MPSKLLELVVKVKDQASAELDKIRGSTGEPGKGALGAGDAFLALASKIGLAALATDKIVGFIDDNLNDWQAYVFEIDNLAKAFGLTYEETEKLVYIADLYTVSNDALFSSLNKLAREGLGTGTDALNALRLEFQAIEDPAERATYLFGMAGEQGQKVLGPLLEMSDIDWNNLIEGLEHLENVDGEMVDNARELEAATAGMKQEWTELKIILANWSAPGVTALLQLMQTPLSPDSAGAFLFKLGLTGDPNIPSVWGHGNEPWDTARGQEASSERWEELARTMRNLPNDIKDAVREVQDDRH